MNFVLTPQMIDKIGFAMEDQKEQYTVNVETGELTPVSGLGPGTPEETFVRLPRWGSAEGFHLMESFVTSLDNPAYREQLSRALTMGRGVFRAFKDVLKQNKEIEKLWFAYKERRLRGVIVSWYNANREARGLEKLPVEPEETEELVMSDFSFSWDPDGHPGDIEALDRDAFFGLFPDEDPARLEERFQEKRHGLEPPGAETSPVLLAETPAGELAGFAWGRIEGTTVHIVQLAVWQGLRGIGLGEALLRQFLLAMRARGMRRLTTELMGRSLRSTGFFQSVGFTPVTQVMECSLDQLPF
jgi:ribosomal protein S18 acetylase RimI-like enzyme